MIEIIITIISTIFVVLGWIIHRKTEQIKIMENQLSERKYKAYAEMVAVFYRILKDVKNQKITNQNAVMEKIIESKRDILLYGSDAVFDKFNKWLCSATEEKEDNTQMKYFLELVLEMRKDMRGGKTKITEKDILLNLIQNRSEVDDFLQLITKEK
ncbi:hypothetical protein SDC9_31831 [bioreactor metagenome]|uniref:DUF4760 domain-containing protein n=1 Tax=bioreactor metagenome TaxID=1076179 RepID=A0A644V3T0_9ZZZZ